MLKNKLKSNKLSIGSWVTIGHPSIVEIMASAGFDWLTIDMEHSSITFDQAQLLIATIKNNKMDALVRVGKNDELIIKRVMDAGADGIIVPMVSSRLDAERAVEYVKYPPIGKRGVGLARAQNYGLNFNEYKDWVESSSIVIAQIEHINAVNRIDEIINVPGIDGIIIGPYDLSASLGIAGQLKNPLLMKAVKSVETECLKAKFPLGYHVINTDHKSVIDKIRKGYSLIGFSLDFFFLGNLARKEMSKINEK